MSRENKKVFVAKRSPLVIFGFTFVAWLPSILLLLVYVLPENSFNLAAGLLSIVVVPVAVSFVFSWRPVVLIDGNGILYKGRLMRWDDIEGVYAVPVNDYGALRSSEESSCVVKLTSGEEVVVKMWNTRRTAVEIIAFCHTMQPSKLYNENGGVLTREAKDVEALIAKGAYIALAVAGLWVVLYFMFAMPW